MIEMGGQRVLARSWLAAVPSRRTVVLMYHGFTEAARTDDPENLFVRRTDFETQLDHLVAHGWEPLDLDGFLARARGAATRGKCFLVTIDDGLQSVASLAVPVLRARSIPAVLFVPAGLVGGTANWLPQPAGERLLDARALRAMAQNGLIEVGAHAHEHVDMRGLDSRQLERHTTHAHEALEDITGRPVRAFAYPFGAHDLSARDAVARSGYTVAFSVFEDEGQFAVSRVDVNATDTLLSLRLKLVPGYRTWWHMLGRASFVRRLVKSSVTRRPHTTRDPDREVR